MKYNQLIKAALTRRQRERIKFLLSTLNPFNPNARPTCRLPVGPLILSAAAWYRRNREGHHPRSRTCSAAWSGVTDRRGNRPGTVAYQHRACSSRLKRPRRLGVRRVGSARTLLDPVRTDVLTVMRTSSEMPNVLESETHIGLTWPAEAGRNLAALSPESP
jgi:hypothetical protein